jgi:hypothetical protein
VQHASYCAVHNAPALPIGKCSCGADEELEMEYKCCGIRFPLALGKYGCPNCCGDRVARLVKVADSRALRLTWKVHDV